MPKADRYRALYERSIQDPAGFWAEQAERLHWHTPWHSVLDQEAQPLPRWFTGGEINACYNCVDRHVEAGHGNDTALIYESPVTDTS